MIRGIGLDLAELDRIEQSLDRFGDSFIKRILTPNEEAQLPKKNNVPRITALFAGKEAAVKALGTGFANGVGFHDVEIIHNTAGKPEITFLGRGKEIMNMLNAQSAFISLTHSTQSAAAVVILEGN